MNINSSKIAPSFFSTTSLEIAAYLLASDAEFLGYERSPDGRLVFQFPADCQALIPQYFAGEMVPAIRLWGEIKRLKSLVHAG